MNVVIDDGSDGIKLRIPAAVFVRQSCVMDGFSIDGETNTISANSWKVGNGDYTVAENLRKRIDTNNDEYQVSDENAVLVHQALIDGGFSGQSVTVHVTLPLKRFYKNGAKNAELIERKRANLMRPVENLGGLVPAVISDVRVWPEGLPAWFNLCLDDTGNQIKQAERVLVVDTGGTTTDTALIRADDFQIERYDSLDCGVFNITESMALDIGQRNIMRHHLINILKTGTYKNETAEAIVSKATAPVINQILRKMRAFEPEPETLDYIIYVGGGSGAIGSELNAAYGGNGVIMDDYETATASGIYKMLMAQGEI